MATMAMMDTADDDRLQSRASLFDSLVALIPPRFYLPVPESTAPPRFIHNKREKAPKQAIKEGSQKARRLKLDPTAFKSVLDLQAEESSAAITVPETSSVEEKALSTSDLVPMPAPVSVVELKQRLQDKIALLAAKRMGHSAPQPGAATNGKEESQKPKSRQEILEKRRAKKEDRKKKAKKAANGPARDAARPNLAPVTPTHKKENLKFGKVEFAETSTRAILRNPDAALSSANNSINNNNISKRKRGPVDVKGQLQQALNKKKKFETLQSKDAEKASSILETQKWSKVEALAAGDKIKDDISLLKKSVKKKEAMKKKSAAVWDKRVETVKKQGLDRQKKRNENLQARKNDKRSGKNKGGKKSVGAMEAKKAKAKKAARPGFEGGKKKVKSKK